MTDYRRANLEGGCFFFTVVTYDRRAFLTEPLARRCLREAWRETRRHIDYIHCNLVKHSLVEHVEDWPWSSYHRVARTCAYPDQYWQTAQSGFDDLTLCE
jgi:REP element-mobilizing transposase RayT